MSLFPPSVNDQISPERWGSFPHHENFVLGKQRAQKDHERTATIRLPPPSWFTSMGTSNSVWCLGSPTGSTTPGGLEAHYTWARRRTAAWVVTAACGRSTQSCVQPGNWPGMKPHPGSGACQPLKCSSVTRVMRL